MTEPDYDTYNRMIDIQTVLKEAGLKQYLPDGKTRPSYYQVDDKGRRLHGTNYIVNPKRNNCFHRGDMGTMKPVAFILAHPEMFAEWNSKTTNKYHLAHLVCQRILNMPEELRKPDYAKNAVTQVDFDWDSYTKRRYVPGSQQSIKAFYPYFSHRKINVATQKAFSQHFFITEKPAKDGATTLKNLSFPMHRPEDMDTVVGLELRGMGRKDGTSYKGMAAGSDHAKGMWIAPLGWSETAELSQANNVYWFESAYDAMAYYQLHNQDKDVQNGVFVSTGGNPTEAQMKSMIEATPESTHHVCFDNDEAGQQYARNFARIVDDLCPKSNLKKIGEYDIPEWAVCAIENGDKDGLTEEEEKELDQFLERDEFKDGFVIDWDWEDTDDFNRYPEFGERNQSALTNRGESPYFAVSTVKAHFYHPTQREVELPLKAQRELPREGCKDWNEQLKQDVEELQREGVKTERGTLHKTEDSGMDLDGDGITDDVEVDQDVEDKKKQTFGRSHR